MLENAEKAPDAAEAMGLTSTVLEGLGIVDATIKEPLGGAHLRDIDVMANRIKEHLIEQLAALKALPQDPTIGQTLPALDVLRQRVNTEVA